MSGRRCRQSRGWRIAAATPDRLRVPPFNGRLFSPVHAPLAETVPLDEAAVRNALLALTTRATAGGRERIAYADLGVEHLGGVYERVLDYDVKVRLARSHRSRREVDDGKPPARSTRRGLSPSTWFDGRWRHSRSTPTPDDMLRLRVLDPAMGSGAFLVAGMPLPGARIRVGPRPQRNSVHSGSIRRDRAGFRRTVAQRCLYGVDLNPMAVQLARLSLWLTTHVGRPSAHVLRSQPACRQQPGGRQHCGRSAQTVRWASFAADRCRCSMQSRWSAASAKPSRRATRYATWPRGYDRTGPREGGALCRAPVTAAPRFRGGKPSPTSGAPAGSTPKPGTSRGPRSRR